ncbi:MAG: hypothetical protein G01um101425_834 [Candidatus Peregrinibacteria bacterium Gr01-1014_25]|nr:MAG: hypothetical protein G01um101425_834 [Candidatus Peregrinibacteria bacterium Gr01-1014_25]
MLKKILLGIRKGTIVFKNAIVAIAIGIAWVISIVVMIIILPPCFVWVQYKLYVEDKRKRMRINAERKAALVAPKGVQNA